MPAPTRQVIAFHGRDLLAGGAVLRLDPERTHRVRRAMIQTACTMPGM